MDKCLSDSDLSRFLANRMDEGEENLAREHLAKCPRCAGRKVLLAAGTSGDTLSVSGAQKGDDPIDVVEGFETEPLRLSPDPPRPRFSIEGYEIVRELHRGGQGVVYQAIQSSTRRKVAIKVLLEGPYASKSSQRRFVMTGRRRELGFVRNWPMRSHSRDA